MSLGETGYAHSQNISPIWSDNLKNVRNSSS